MGELRLIYRLDPERTEFLITMKQVMLPQHADAELLRLSNLNTSSHYRVRRVDPPADGAARKRVHQGSNIWDVVLVVFYLERPVPPRPTADALDSSFVVHGLFNTEGTAQVAMTELSEEGHSPVLQSARFYPFGRNV